MELTVGDFVVGISVGDFVVGECVVGDFVVGDFVGDGVGALLSLHVGSSKTLLKPHVIVPARYPGAQAYLQVSPVRPVQILVFDARAMCFTLASALGAQARLPTHAPPRKVPLPSHVCTPSAW